MSKPLWIYLIALLHFTKVLTCLAICSWSSSAGESHPHALTQRYVNLSIHTAPIVQPRPDG
jgi:hypothetical protein